MKLESLSRIRRPLRILLTISIIVTGFCLMGACLSIYLSGGDQAFSRESVAAAFRPIALPVWLCLGLTVLSFPVQLLPCPAETQLPQQQVRMALARMQERIDISLCPDELNQQIQDLRRNRKIYETTGKLVLILSTVIFLFYGLNGKNFHSSHINQSMIRAMFWLLPCIVVPFVLYLFIEKKTHASMAKELELLKSAPKESRIVPPRHRNNRRRNLYLRTGLLIVAVLILIGGFFIGGSNDVLTKAVNICTECIGLG